MLMVPFGFMYLSEYFKVSFYPVSGSLYDKISLMLDLDEFFIISVTGTYIPEVKRTYGQTCVKQDLGRNQKKKKNV